LLSNGNGSALTNFTSTQITNALGFTPYNATNPNNYISTVNGTAITPTSTNGVSAATMAFMDATSSVQTQLNNRVVSNTAITGATFPKITYDAKGLVTGGAALASGDIPNNAANTTGTAANVTGIVAVANGGTGTATPGLVQGTNVTITGAWPNQTISATGGGGGITYAQAKSLNFKHR